MCLERIKEPELVGGFDPSEKYESIGMIIPNIWVWVKTPGPPWICGSLLFNRVLNGGIERGVLNGELGGVLNGEFGGVLNGGHFLNKHPTQPDRS